MTPHPHNSFILPSLNDPHILNRPIVNLIHGPPSSAFDYIHAFKKTKMSPCSQHLKKEKSLFYIRNVAKKILPILLLIFPHVIICKNKANTIYSNLHLIIYVYVCMMRLVHGYTTCI